MSSLGNIQGLLERPYAWIALAVLVFTPLVHTEIELGNVASDLAAIESIVERGTFFINGSTFENTIDKFKRGDRFFSQKSPIFHLVAAVPHSGLRAMGFRLATHYAICLRVLTLFMVILPMGFLVWLVYRNAWIRTQPFKIRVALALALMFGSLLTPFAVTLNHYTLASACLLAAVNLITEYRVQGREPDRRLALLAGFWISASLASDIPPAFIFGSALGVYWLVKRPKLVPWLAAGAAPLALLYAALNVVIIGSPLPPNFHEREMLYFEGSYWKEMEENAARFGPGYFQASYALRIFHSTLGYKGMLWMMPLLAVALIAAAREMRKRTLSSPLALAWMLFPFATIAVTMRWAIDLSGGAYGIRHAFAAVPPLYCALGLIDWQNVRCLARCGAVTAGAFGLLIAVIGLMNPWSHNTLSAIPPVENLAHLAIRHPNRLPTKWIEASIEYTSVEPASAWLDLGRHYDYRGRLADAESALRRSIKANPELPLPYYHLGVVLDQMNRPREAMAVYEKLLAMEPENVGAWNNLGFFALHAGDLQRAGEAHEHSLKLHPENAGAMWGTLVREDMLGRADPDSPLLARALELHPNDHRIAHIARRWRAKSEP